MFKMQDKTKSSINEFSSIQSFDQSSFFRFKKDRLQDAYERLPH